MKKARTVHLLFRIFYTSFFTILNIALVALLLITPGDAIRQALSNKQLYNVFVVAGCYLLTVILAILIYASRLYTNRTVLTAIPKNWIPIEKGEVNTKVRKMIVASLSRNAVIAWDARPRVEPTPAAIVSEPERRDPIAVSSDLEKLGRGKKKGLLHKRTRDLENEEETVVIPPPQPVWGDISHDGWASPTSPDLPNLQFTTVILELPHLIEARAVSLAPPDPKSPSERVMPNIEAVQLLQRPASMGLRDYINHLIAINVIRTPSITMEFVDKYEYARFGTRALGEHAFRDLMKLFAEILRGMMPLSPGILLEFGGEEESDIDDDATSSPTPVTPRSRSIASSFRTVSRSGSEGTIHTAPSRQLQRSRMGGAYSTAPATPRKESRAVGRSPSEVSFARSRGVYEGSVGSGSLSESGTQGSVIKLNMEDREGGEEGALPYTLSVPPIV
jgi:hypothetical protein